MISALKGEDSEMNSCLIFTNSGWLDDIGLPQYKDQFHEARVDGRMIQYLTVVSHYPPFNMQPLKLSGGLQMY